jgi:hypothetical protein
MKNKRIGFLIILTITLLKIILLIPYKVTGGVAGINEIRYLNIFSAVSLSNSNDCIDCFNYSLLLDRAIVEAILVFSISFIVILIISKSLKIKPEYKHRNISEK